MRLSFFLGLGLWASVTLIGCQTPLVPQVRTYSLTYHANGAQGSLPSDDSAYAPGAEVTLLSAGGLTKGGCSFSGWNTQAGGSGTAYAPGATLTMGSANVVLYAQWKPLRNTITFDANGGSGTMAPVTLEFQASCVLNTRTFDNAGYDFSGWNTQADGKGTRYADQSWFTMGTSSVVLYAQWSAQQHWLSFNPNGGSGSMSFEVLSTKDETNLPAVTFASPGYTFTGWNTQSNGKGAGYADKGMFTMGPFSVTLYAQWVGNTNTIAFNANGGTGSMNSFSLTTGSQTTLEANTFTRDGYTFLGWNFLSKGYGLNLKDKAILTMPEISAVLYAQWEANQNLITFDPNLGTGSMAPQTLSTGTSSFLMPNSLTRAGYAFSGWNTLADGTGTAYANNASLTMGTQSFTLYAQWTNLITYNANGGWGAMAPQTLAANTSAVLTPNAFYRPAYRFVGWNTQADGTGENYADNAPFMMGSQAVTLFAQWTNELAGTTSINPIPAYEVGLTGPNWVNYDRTGTFQSAYTGRAKRYQWYLNGAPVPGAIEPTFYLYPTPATVNYGTNIVMLSVTDANGIIYSGAIAFTAVY